MHRLGAFQLRPERDRERWAVHANLRGLHQEGGAQLQRRLQQRRRLVPHPRLHRPDGRALRLGGQRRLWLRGRTPPPAQHGQRHHRLRRPDRQQLRLGRRRQRRLPLRHCGLCRLDVPLLLRRHHRRPAVGMHIPDVRLHPGRGSQLRFGCGATRRGAVCLRARRLHRHGGEHVHGRRERRRWKLRVQRVWLRGAHPATAQLRLPRDRLDGLRAAGPRLPRLQRDDLCARRQLRHRHGGWALAWAGVQPGELRSRTGRRATDLRADARRRAVPLRDPWL
mmetsp:Transcript_21927/g.53884  ORF Transcript_21927/g.53884 Transcript_21927/m.53884 type:complete len:279 (+) Transcript_21927:751-1587(+)